MTGGAWTLDDLELLEWAELARPRVEALQEALDDLWGCIAWDETQHLQPETVELAKANHEHLHHGGKAGP